MLYRDTGQQSHLSVVRANHLPAILYPVRSQSCDRAIRRSTDRRTILGNAYGRWLEGSSLHRYWSCPCCDRGYSCAYGSDDAFDCP